MMKQMGINPNNLPKNMPNMGGMDMSALEGMMGQGGMPDLSALGEQEARYEPDVWWRFER